MTIFEAEIAVKCTFLRKWMKDRAMSEDEMDIRAILDWVTRTRTRTRTLTRTLTRTRTLTLTLT